MGIRLKTPKAVLEARESKTGLNWGLEILVFIALFAVCAIGEAVAMIPVQLVLLMQDKSYLDAAAADDLEGIEAAAMRMAGSDAYMIAALFSSIAMIAVVALFCKLVQKRKLSSLGFVKRDSGIEYFRGAMLGFGMFSAAVLICVLTGSVRLAREPGTFAISSLLLFFAGYMIQGMAEEVLCRGYFMVSLGRRHSMEAAAVINAVAFAALHLNNPGVSPLAIVNLILFGIFASVCFIRTENIWLVGALHSVWNFSQGNIYGIKVSGLETICTVFTSSMTEGRDLIHGGSFGLEGGLAVTIVLIAGIAVLYLYKNDRRREKQYEAGIEGHL